MLPMLYHQCISEQFRKFGLDFLDGKGTFNHQHIVIEALFLGRKWLTAIFYCMGGFLRWFHVAQAGFKLVVYLRIALNS